MLSVSVVVVVCQLHFHFVFIPCAVWCAPCHMTEKNNFLCWWILLWKLEMETTEELHDTTNRDLSQLTMESAKKEAEFRCCSISHKAKATRTFGNWIANENQSEEVEANRKWGRPRVKRREKGTKIFGKHHNCFHSKSFSADGLRSLFSILIFSRFDRRFFGSFEMLIFLDTIYIVFWDIFIYFVFIGIDKSQIPSTFRFFFIPEIASNQRSNACESRKVSGFVDFFALAHGNWWYVEMEKKNSQQCPVHHIPQFVVIWNLNHEWNCQSSLGWCSVIITLSPIKSNKT